MDTEDLLKLKMDLEKVGKEIDQKQGALDQMMNNLKELGFDSTKKAQKEIDRLEDLIKEKEEELEEDMEKIEEVVEGWDD